MLLYMRFHMVNTGVIICMPFAKALRSMRLSHSIQGAGGRRRGDLRKFVADEKEDDSLFNFNYK